MADVRAMLRAERASRAPPSSKARKAAAALAPTPASVVASKKRKADDDDVDTRKRARPQQENANLPAGFFDERASSAEEDEAPRAPIPGFVPAAEEEARVESKQKASQKTSDDAPSLEEQISAQPPDNIDEAEWAAFQAFTTSVPSKTSALDALNSNATIEAAPLTTEQAAAQARDADAQSKSRSKREEEIEEEKEDAAERLEEEFEVMGELEDRIRRLKEKREVLRRASRTSNEGGRPVVQPTADVPDAVVEEESEESEEEVDEFEGWRFGSR